MKTLPFVIPLVMSARGLASASSFDAAEDAPKVVETRCTTQPARANFQQISKDGTVVYRFDGSCVIRWDTKPGDFPVRYEVEAKWTPNNRTAYETAKIYNLGSVLPDLFQKGQATDYIAYVARYLCEDDPWRTEKRCGLELLGDPGNLRDLFPEVAYPPYPFTRQAISPVTRAGINDAFAKAAAAAAKAAEAAAGVSEYAAPDSAVLRRVVPLAPPSGAGNGASAYAAPDSQVVTAAKFQLSGQEPPAAVKARYGAAYDAGALQNLKKGETKKVTVLVTNNGTLAWTPNQFHLGYHWYQGANQVVKDGIRTTLTTATATNQTTTFNTRVQAPSAKGTYTLKWDMAEGSTYFSSKGARTGDQTVIVK